jgi:hypothetical protein
VLVFVGSPDRIRTDATTRRTLTASVPGHRMSTMTATVVATQAATQPHCLWAANRRANTRHPTTIPTLATADLEDFADTGVRVFLTAYGES